LEPGGETNYFNNETHGVDMSLFRPDTELYDELFTQLMSGAWNPVKGETVHLAMAIIDKKHSDEIK